MSLKRSRVSYEADASTSYAAFGTPLPAQSDQDGGAYVPLWKQEVKDDKGRKRLHGAFTGGWSAGYFNTVGSKEGWAPASFVSSRGNRRGTSGQYAPQRPEDFMDEEDLAEAEEAKKLQTTDAFAGIGIGPENMLDHGGISGISGLLGSQDSTTGFRLLQRMGWKPGQGIGPKVQRGARLGGASGDPATAETYSFAPDDTEIAEIVPVTGNHGLGYVESSAGRARPLLGILGAGAANLDGDEEDGFGQPSRGSRDVHKGPKGRSRETTGIGVGILNDTGSDDDDPFELGPKISYNRVADGRASKRKKNQTRASIPAAQPLAAHGLSQPVPVYLSKRARDRGQSRSDGGKTQLGGFVLSTRARSDSLVKHTPPPVPEGWVSAKLAAAQQVLPAAVAPIKTGLGPASRGAILGEESLRGKSVFDYITSSSRDRVVAATGNKDLPPGRGDSQVAAAAAAALGTAGQNLATSSNSGPPLDKATALAALARSYGGGNNSPYMGQGEKQARYGVFLKFAAGLVSSGPKRPPDLSAAEFGREQQEFASCAKIFKPMTGLMASRFTTAASPSDPPPPAAREAPGLATPVSAEEAAKLNMHGTLTRIVKPFTPNSLLCKRCDIKVSSDRAPKPPVQPDDCQGQPDRIHSPLAHVGSAAAHQQQPSSGEGSSGGQKDMGAQPGGGDTWSDLGAAREEALRAIFGSDSDD